jgi:hypothetical protein
MIFGLYSDYFSQHQDFLNVDSGYLQCELHSQVLNGY